MFFEGRATWHQKFVARPGMSGMFWAPNVWAACLGDAGNAEEELLVQQNTSAVYPTRRVALALRARRHTEQLDFPPYPPSQQKRVFCCMAHFRAIIYRVLEHVGPQSRLILESWRPLIVPKGFEQGKHVCRIVIPQIGLKPQPV